MSDLSAIVRRLVSMGGHPTAQAAAVLQAAASLDPPPVAQQMDVLRLACARPDNPLPLLPEIKSLMDLDQGLPPALRFPDASAGLQRMAARAAAVVADTNEGRQVQRTMEATTPWLETDEPFAALASRTDRLDQWCVNAPQITVLATSARLPLNGALWRGRLRKRTEPLTPLASLATEETIEVTANGRDAPDGTGHRCYDHVLVDSAQGPELLTLLEDSGRIELVGNAHGAMLRLRKRVTVSWAVKLDDRYGAALEIFFPAMLRLWAESFLGPQWQQGATQSDRDAEVEPVPAQKASPARSLPHDKPLQIAVLGGGPAGLACAWLLSKPTLSSGKPAWSARHADAPGLTITVVEAEGHLGGKAASRERSGPLASGIEEHGLHVLMGCYDNLLSMLKHLGAAENLDGVDTASVPGRGRCCEHPADLLPLRFNDWRPGPDEHREPLLQWLRNRKQWSQSFDDQLLSGWHAQLEQFESTRARSGPQQGALDSANARPAPRPALRAAILLWQAAAARAPSADDPVDGRHIQNLALQVLCKQMAVDDLAQDAELQRMKPAPGGVHAGGGGRGRMADYARLARSLGRAALPCDHPSPDVRLAGEAMELGMTLIAALDNAGLYPGWAADGVTAEDGAAYAAWADRVKAALDGHSLADWLKDQQCSEAVAQRGGLLDALTAALFTTPQQVAAGTFVHGLVRLLLCYRDAPFKRMKGGTSEVVIQPLADALRKAGVTLVPGAEVQSLLPGANGLVESVGMTSGGQERTLEADAFVLAIPPYAGTAAGEPVAGLPPDLVDKLKQIGHVATLGLQHWSDVPPRYPGTIQAGLQAPFRCAAAMDHLKGKEGAAYPQAPVYWCGEVGDDEASRWNDHKAQMASQWLKDHAAEFSGVKEQQPHFLSVNHVGSARYTLADVETQGARPAVDDPSAPGNLWLAGDWTQSPMACGSIEAAVTSGLMAARSILQALDCEVHFPISGVSAS